MGDYTDLDCIGEVVLGKLEISGVRNFFPDI